ncbi:MAG: DUF6868 family protein [Pseudomonadota bacterium]
MTVNVELLSDFLLWCLLLNGGLLVTSVLVFALARNAVFGIHSFFLPISREHHAAMVFGYLGEYKVLIIVFNLVPWIVLSQVMQ